MTNELNELEKQVVARKKEALKKNIFNKVRVIAEELGVNFPNCEDHFCFKHLETGGLDISYHVHGFANGGEFSQVIYGHGEEECVFSAFRDSNPSAAGYGKFKRGNPRAKVEIKAYNPTVGNWVKQIDSLYRKAKKSQKSSTDKKPREKTEKERREMEKERREIEALRANFGL